MAATVLRAPCEANEIRHCGQHFPPPTSPSRVSSLWYW
jgi:hypothetical protein